MESLGDLGINIKIDWQKVNRSLKRVSAATAKVSSSIAKKVSGAMRGISQAALTATKNTIRIFTSAFSKIVQIIKKAMIVSGVAISGFIVYSTKLAIEVEEIESLFEHSFGNMAESVREWSETYSESVKSNKYDSLSFLSTIYNMTKSMGLTKDQAIDTSKAVVEIANDLKSAYNLKGNSAFDKIRSGLAGESEPLKQIGILLTENTVKEYAYANGIAKRGKALTDQQKVIARLGKLQEATANIQGNMLMTLTSTQNRIRALTDGFKEFSINMGKSIKGSDTFKRLLSLVERVAVKVKVAIENKLVRALQVLDTHFGNEKNRKKWTAFFSGVGKIMAVISAVIKKVVSDVIQFGNSEKFLSAFKETMLHIRDISGFLLGHFKKLTKAIYDFINDGDEMKKLKERWENFADTIKISFVFLSAIGKVFNSVAKLLLKYRDAMLSISNTPKGGLFDISMIIALGIALKGILKNLFTLKGLKGLFKFIGTSLKLLVTGQLKELLGYFTRSFIPNIHNGFMGVLKWLGKIKLALMGKWKFTPIKGLIQTFKTLGGWLKTIGGYISSVWMGFVTALGLVTTASAAVVTALSAVAAVVGWLTGKGLVALNGWLVKNVEWFGNLQSKLDDFWASVLDKLPLWKRMFGIKKDPNAEKAAEIRAQKQQQATIPSPSSLSGAYAQNGMGDKAMLAKMDALIIAVNSQPAKQHQLDRIRV